MLNLTGLCFVSLPTSLHFLVNLHSLHLDGCQLDDVAIIGELKQLVSLSFANSYIVELPTQIEQLSQLKLLDLTNCTQLKVFPANVLFKLSLLEELYMGNSFIKWDVEGNISIIELEELYYLTTLEMQVIDAKKMPNRLFFRGLQRYKIFIGDGWVWDVTYEASKILKLRLKTFLHMEDGLKELLKGTQVLYLDDVRGINNLLHEIDGKANQQLNHLHIQNDNVTYTFRDFFSAQPESIFSKMVIFPNLTSMILRNCGCSKYILKSSTIKCLLQLKRLVIECFEFVEEIILTEESINKIVFSNLDFLRLAELPSLKRFSTLYPIEFQSLKKMEIKECHKLRNIVSNISNRGNNYDVQALFHDMVTFPNLQIMRVSIMDNLENIWHSQLTANSFYNLKSLRISSCRNLLAVFSSNLVRRFQRLEDLFIYNCPVIEEIYQLGELNSDEVTIFELRYLKIYSMESLKRIMSNEGRDRLFSFQNLKSVEAHECEVMEYVFPASIACGLLQLEQLRVRRCGVEHIVGKTKSIEADEAPRNFNFPKLTFLQLQYLRRLKNFYPKTYSCEWPKLKYLKVRGCHKDMTLDVKVGSTLEKLTLNCENSIEFLIEPFSALKVMKLSHLKDEGSGFPFGFLRWLHSLEKLVLTSCYLECMESILFDYETIVGERENVTSIVPLKYLKVELCDRLKYIASSSVSFQNLTTLHVVSCDQLENLVTISSAKTMVHLMELKITYCEMMKEIVTNNGDDIEHEIIFNHLKRLELRYLPIIYSFCSGNYVFRFPLLEEVIVEDCLQMKIFCSGVLSTPKLQGVRHWKFQKAQYWEKNLNTTITYQCYRKKVLQNAYNWYVIKDPSSSTVILANQLQLFDNLRKINVRDCDSVQVIFDVEGVSDGSWHADLLPKLEELLLINLPKLNELWNKIPVSMFDFRNLRLLKVQNCSSLKYAFTQSMASSLIELQKIEVENCKMMMAIIKEEEAEETKLSKMRLPLLEKISIKGCPSMKDFMSPILSREQNPRPNQEGIGEQIIGMQKLHQIAMPRLEELRIDWDMIKHKLDGNNQLDILTRLKVIELVFPPYSFPTMESLVLSDALVEELIIYELDNHHELPPRLRKIILTKLPNLKLMVYDNDPRKVSIFHNLQVLQVWECKSLKTLVPSFVYFKNLTFLQVSTCEGLINLITASTTKSLVQLRTMYIGRCKMMQEIVVVKSDEEEEEIGFPRLQYLVLDDLPCLTNFCSSKNTFDFPYLEEVFVIKCSNMKMFAQVLNTPKLCQVQVGRKEYEWEWEGSLDSTIQALYMKRKK